MRKLKLQLQMTVDGFIGGPNGEMDWISQNWDDQLLQYVGDLTGSIGTIVLGRKLAQGFIPHWAAVKADQSHPEYAGGVVFTDTPKVVFTRTLARSEWDNTVLAKENIVDEITRLKKQDGKPIYACGGATFAADLVKHNLIDEYHLFVNPTAIGKGLSIFKTLDAKQNLSLKRSVAFPCGIVVLCYEPRMS